MFLRLTVDEHRAGQRRVPFPGLLPVLSPEPGDGVLLTSVQRLSSDLVEALSEKRPCHSPRRPCTSADFSEAREEAGPRSKESFDLGCSLTLPFPLCAAVQLTDSVYDFVRFSRRLTSCMNNRRRCVMGPGLPS